MQKVVVFLGVAFLLMGGNIRRGDGIVADLAADCAAECSKNTDIVSAQQFISEPDNGMQNICEKPTFACRIISVAVRLLPTTVMFKELHTKHILKNKILIRETVADICFSRKQQDGFYTYGVGYLRI
ncbi:MAG: hypothetical protein FWH36_08665 [Lentimicrobiaceae bacterium]|nr:hypothetical protein [Lentimicrobiaceae bacterium]